MTKQDEDSLKCMQMSREWNERNMKFKKGEKIAFYSGLGRESGIVLHVNEDDTLVVEYGIGNQVRAHSKQCRRLKPKKKRRSVWLSRMWLAAPPTGPFISTEPMGGSPDWIEFREVVKK